MERAKNTMPREKKGPVVPPPALSGALAAVADGISVWPGVIATGHWTFYKPRQIDGIDFYVGDEELGHIHLDGDLHLATSPNLAKAMIANGLARPFPYQEGWVHQDIAKIGAPAAIALFRSNYERIVKQAD